MDESFHSPWSWVCIVMGVGAVSVEKLRLMSELLGWRVQSLSCDIGVEGVMVFGSFARGSVTGSSDLDLFVVRSDLKETYSRVRAEERGTVIEENSWSIQTLEELFCGGGEGEIGLFTDLFLVNVFRSGRILYDPSGKLCSYQEHSRGYRIPQKYLTSLREKADNTLSLAEHITVDGGLEEAELEVRKGAEEVYMYLLLEQGVLEIHPPKILLPQTRLNLPNLHTLFLQVQNLENPDRDKVQSYIKGLESWRKKLVREITQLGRTDWLSGSLHGARSELSNAERSLERTDPETALLVVRYTAILLMTPVLRLIQGQSTDRRSDRYRLIAQNQHPYLETFRPIMGFHHNREELEERIQSLRHLRPKTQDRTPQK